MAQYLEWHMSQAGASDALLQQRLVAALSHLKQHASPEAFRKASRCAATPPQGHACFQAGLLSWKCHPPKEDIRS